MKTRSGYEFYVRPSATVRGRVFFHIERSDEEANAETMTTQLTLGEAKKLLAELQESIKRVEKGKGKAL